MKKFFKKFFIYLAFIIGILLVAVLACLAFMYFSPGTSVLGYEYVLYSNKTKSSYTTETELSINGVQAVEIITGITDVYIQPNKTSNEILVSHSEGLSGFCKSLNADLKITTKVVSKSFEESTSTYKTFSVNIDEPDGWIAKSNAYVCIYIPEELSINTIYVKSNGANINYTSEIMYEEQDPEDEKQKIEITKVLECVNLYLKTGDYGKLSIDTKNGISNYYLKTEIGKVDFLDVTTINASTLKFETGSGLFNLTNKDKTATLNLTNNLEIISYDDSVGPTIKIDNLNANLKVTANNGTYKINNIGKEGSNKVVAMSMNKSYIDFGNVYGYVSILSEGNDVDNKINIKNIKYNGLVTNTIESGSGYINIENLNGNATFDTTSGNISVGNATVNSNIYAYSTSGAINIVYAGSTSDNKDTNLIVLTRTGDISLKNISCSLDVQVLANSNSKLDIIFTSIAFNDNIIDAKNRKVNIVLKGVSDSLQSRIVCTKEITIAEGTAGQLISSVADQDYLVNLPSYTEYSKAYRLGYTKNDANYNTNAYDRWGKILLKTTGSVLVSSVS